MLNPASKIAKISMSFISAACRLILIFLFAVVPISGSGTNVDDCFKRRIWNVRPYEYGGDSQIWSIANDGKGCVYLAAGTDVCVWDGYVWESYSVNGKSVIRYLFWDDATERLYCTGDNFFGFWRRNRFGVFEYSSLYSNDDFSMNRIFWRAIPSGDSFYLQSHEALYRYDSGHLELVVAGKIGYAFLLNDTIYIQIDNALCAVSGSQLTKIAPAPDDRIVFLDETADGSILMLTEMSGFFRISPDTGSSDPVYAGASRFFSKMRVFSASKLSSGHYMVGTVLDGAYVINRQGDILEKFTSGDGLAHTTVLSMDEDIDGNIILGLDGSAAWVWGNESPRFFSSQTNRIGNIYASAFWNGALYLGTNKGLYRVGADCVPQILPNTQGQIWDLIPLKRTLAVIADKGLFSLNTSNTYDLISPDIWRIIPVLGKKGAFCASDKSGLVILTEDQDGRISIRNRMENYSNPDNSVLFDKYGYLWVDWLRGKVRKLVPDMEHTRIKESREYLVDKDANRIVRAFRVDGEVVFAAGTECYTYMPHLDSVVLNEYYTDLFSRFGTQELNIFQQGNHFFNYAENTVDVLVRSGSEVRITRDLFRSAEFEQLPKRFRRIQMLGDTAAVCGFSETLGLVSVKNSNRNAPPTVYLNRVTYVTRGQQLQAALDEELNFPFSVSDMTFTVSSAPHSSLEYRIDGGKWNPVDGPIVVKYIESGIHMLEVGCGGKTLKFMEFSVKKHFTSTWWLIMLVLILLVVLVYVGKHLYKSRVRRLKSRYEARQKELIEKEHCLHQNEMLSLELKERDKKLSMLALNDMAINNMLNEILDQLQAVTDASNKNTLKPVKRCIEKYKRDNGTWKTFELYFNGIFDGFFDRLRAQYPNLTNNDMKICAYVKLGMSTKEIAALMNIEISSAESARYRLRKNMGLAQSDSLTEIVSKI